MKIKISLRNVTSNFFLEFGRIGKSTIEKTGRTCPPPLVLRRGTLVSAFNSFPYLRMIRFAETGLHYSTEHNGTVIKLNETELTSHSMEWNSYHAHSTELVELTSRSTEQNCLNFHQNYPGA